MVPSKKIKHKLSVHSTHSTITFIMFNKAFKHYFSEYAYIQNV